MWEGTFLSLPERSKEKLSHQDLVNAVHQRRDGDGEEEGEEDGRDVDGEIRGAQAVGDGLEGVWRSL